MFHGGVNLIRLWCRCLCPVCVGCLATPFYRWDLLHVPLAYGHPCDNYNKLSLNRCKRLHCKDFYMSGGGIVGGFVTFPYTHNIDKYNYLFQIVVLQYRATFHFVSMLYILYLCSFNLSPDPVIFSSHYIKKRPTVCIYLYRVIYNIFI